MQATFESLLPIFLLILSGHILCRVKLIDAEGWEGVNQLGYWLFYPALIFVTIVNADFSGLELDTMMLALAVTLPLIFALVLVLWPLLRRTASCCGKNSRLFSRRPFAGMPSWRWRSHKSSFRRPGWRSSP